MFNDGTSSLNTGIGLPTGTGLHPGIHIKTNIDIIHNSYFMAHNRVTVPYCIEKGYICQRNGRSRGRAIAKAVSRRPLTAEARVRSHADPSGRAV